MTIQKLWNDKDTLARLKEAQIAFLKGQATEKLFKREEVSGYADALDALEGFFDYLDELYTSKPQKEPLNEAR